MAEKVSKWRSPAHYNASAETESKWRSPGRHSAGSETASKWRSLNRHDATSSLRATRSAPASFFAAFFAGRGARIALLLACGLVILRITSSFSLHQPPEPKPPHASSDSPAQKQDPRSAVQAGNLIQPGSPVENGSSVQPGSPVEPRSAVQSGRSVEPGSSAQPGIPIQSGSSIQPGTLFDAWTQAYELEAKSKRKLRLPNDTYNASPGAPLTDPAKALGCSVPPAPHLLCCDSLTEAREKADQRGPNGAPPSWTQLKPGKNPAQTPYPRPPWIRGEPEDNLPLTHKVQTDIWMNQFPADKCQANSTRFLLAWWDNPHFHGLGSHIHLMTAVLGLAVQYGRVFGLLNYTFHRAQHDGCAGQHYGSFACYFPVPSSKECDRRANDIWKAKPKDWRSERFYEANRIGNTPNFLELLQGPDPYLVVSPRLLVKPWKTTLVPTIWGKPWLQSNASLVFAEEKPARDTMHRLELNWWRAQGTRFLLRWPSAYLCHLVNFARHQSYGMEAARLVAGSGLQPIEQGDAKGSCVGSPRTCPSSRAAESKGAIDLNPEPFLPHPIVRIHVRGSDKRIEMRLFSLANYIDAACKIRTSRLPNASYIWLSSEEESVFLQGKNISTWTVCSLDMERKRQGIRGEPEQQWLYANKYGLRNYVDASLANLFISEGSDGYVFTLQSNWDRVSNELRLTSGRLHAPVIALNQGDF